MKKFLIALALLSFAATTAQAHGGRGHGHGHHGAAPFLFFGALAAFSIPLLYAQRTQRGPAYDYDGAAPARIYVPAPRPCHAVAGVAPLTCGEVIESGPESLAPMERGRPREFDRSPMSKQDARVGSSFARNSHDCSRWATHESGYDPELRKHRNPQTGPAAYGRALSACLEGNGYVAK